MYLLFAVHIGSWLICDIFYVPPVCMLDIYSPANNTKAINKKNTNQMKIISMTVWNFLRHNQLQMDMWTLSTGLSSKSLIFKAYFIGLLPNEKVR